jgi:hypothetical protein
LAIFSRSRITSNTCFGVAIPLLDFFWNTCRTNTALLNRTAYTVRGVTPKILHQLEDPRITNASQHLRVMVLLPGLSEVERISERLDYLRRQGEQSRLGAPNPDEALKGAGRTLHVMIIPVSV